MSSAEEIVEDVVEIAEETVDAVSDVYNWTCGLSQRQHAMQLLLVGTIAGGLGGVAAYFVGKKRLEAKYEKLIKEEIAEAKAFYSKLHKEEKFDTPQKAVSALAKRAEETIKDEVDEAIDTAADALRNYQGNREDEEPVAETSVGVFVERVVDENFDLEEEMRNRTPDKPYILSQQEFLEAEPGFEQTTITYYAGDGALADDKDEEIPFPDPIVGEKNLERFGHGSGAENLLYIRNERLSMDFEVVLSEGKYAHHVMGFQHSDGGPRARRQKKQPRRFRGEHE